ncbi:hypothetical protein A7U60_g4589 [Sanghuangporus baumii]|uniref:Calcineurin-like phosphoesterase domain-containing protein n=1 Tax=Sanghuangporus baumii TaxID=108892 RepID=A0A9Q5HYD1_SANBA|nr:hypothetical protein A7U60_g4589 [Sanghuangporus baumii]
MLVCLGFVLASTVPFVRSCSDEHVHLPAKRGLGSPSLSLGLGWTIAAPTRPLEWGDLNVLHTTDTHGWLLGHQELSPPEPNYSGTFGDFADFVQHMKETALKKRVDLLLLDSGDIHDGTGLSDGSPPGTIDGHDSNQFLKRLPYDALAIGNHELYVYNNTFDMYSDFALHWKGRYLSSNVNITVPDPSDSSQNVSVPVGSRFAKFRTLMGRRVTSLGVLFDFTGFVDGTNVQPVEDMVKEQWFAEAIEEEPDLFLLVGHMPVSEDNWPIVFDAIRVIHPTTPILIFGGHAHVRDCVQLDGRSMALASGRYMETVGWMSVKFDNKQSSGSGNLTFSRRYLDTNRLTYEFHTGRNNRTFETWYGSSITRGLEELAENYDLSFEYGIAPRDYTISRDPYPSNGSSLTLFIEEAVPIALAVNNTRIAEGIPALFLTNSGSQRFDIFQGSFTKNDELTASPYTNEFWFLSNVSYGIANQVLAVLNVEGSDLRKRGLERTRKRMEEMYKRGDVEMIYNKWLEEMYAREVARARELELDRRADNTTDIVSTMGYVTTDSCPGIGDDTPHTALPFFSTPGYISSIDSPSTAAPLNITSDSTPVDVVFVDFIAEDVLEIINDLEAESGSGKVYTEDDVGLYHNLLSNQVLGVFAQEAWN